MIPHDITDLISYYSDQKENLVHCLPMDFPLERTHAQRGFAGTFDQYTVTLMRLISSENI